MQISHNDQEFFGAFLINHASAIVEHSSADLFPGLQPLLLRRLKLVKEPNKQIFHTKKIHQSTKGGETVLWTEGTVLGILAA